MLILDFNSKERFDYKILDSLSIFEKVAVVHVIQRRLHENQTLYLSVCKIDKVHVIYLF